MGEVFLDALIDTLIILPFLLAMNMLIEFVEYKTSGKTGKALKGGFAPLIGAAVGIVPQCGFSVVATELFSKKKIAFGTLFAVYIATSDEALPIMLSNPQGISKVLPVLIIKVCFALAVGYATFGIEKILERKNAKKTLVAAETDSEKGEKGEKTEVSESGACAHTETEHDETAHDEIVHAHGCHSHAMEEKPIGVSETKKQRAGRIWRVYFKHPIFHTLEVIAYIFAVNVIFGLIVYYVGEDKLAEFMSSTGYLQPVLAALVGLVPNCAGSVVITELYVVGGLNLGGAVAGLSVGAGIAYAVLVKQCKPRDTAIVMATMFVLSVALGICVTACGF